MTEKVDPKIIVDHFDALYSELNESLEDLIPFLHDTRLDWYVTDANEVRTDFEVGSVTASSIEYKGEKNYLLRFVFMESSSVAENVEMKSIVFDSTEEAMDFTFQVSLGVNRIVNPNPDSE